MFVCQREQNFTFALSRLKATTLEPIPIVEISENDQDPGQHLTFSAESVLIPRRDLLLPVTLSQISRHNGRNGCLRRKLLLRIFSLSISARYADLSKIRT